MIGKSWLMVVALGSALTAVGPVVSQGYGADRHVVVISVDGLPGSYLDDPQASLPTLRALASRGARAERGMRVSNPSVTWPNHTSLMTGVHPDRHGVLFNGRVVRGGPNQPTTVKAPSTQAELVRVPLLFDLVHEAGQTAAAINWPCTRGSTSLLANFPDVPNQLDFTTESLKAKLVELPRFNKGNGVVRDEIWVEAACRTIADDQPNLLALHLLNLDSIHHHHGPQSPAGYTAAALMDAHIARILATIDRAGLTDQTDVFIVSDHGFARVPKSIRPNILLRREGLIQAEGDKIQSARVHVIPEGGTGMVYLTDPNTRDADRVTFHRLFDEAEGVAAILEPADYPRYHYPDPATNPGMADMVIAAKNGYAFAGTTAGDDLIAENVEPKASVGTHGFLSTEPSMAATFVAAGPGIKPGIRLDSVDNVDVAPTVARLLSVPLASVEGHVLTEILTQPSVQN